MEDAQEFKGTETHDLLMKILKNPEIIKDKLQSFIDEEKEVFGDSIEQITDLSSYVMQNWRGLVPPLVAFGLSVLLKQTEPAVDTHKTDSQSSDETLLN